MTTSLTPARPASETHRPMPARQSAPPRVEALLWGLVYGGLLSLLGWSLFLRWLLL